MFNDPNNKKTMNNREQDQNNGCQMFRAARCYRTDIRFEYHGVVWLIISL